LFIYYINLAVAIFLFLNANDTKHTNQHKLFFKISTLQVHSDIIFCANLRFLRHLRSKALYN